MSNDATNPASPEDGAPKPPTAGTGRWMLAGCLIPLAAVVVMVIGVTLAGNRDDKPREPSAAEAEIACQDFVRDKLKAPSTAKFSDTTSTATGTLSWNASGSVDSENSFGAMLRSTWTCSIRLDGDTWRATTTVG